MRVALVHDDLVQAGGAERVTACLHDLFPQAPLYTSIYDPRGTLPCFATMDVRTSFLQRWPLASHRLHKLALPFFPAAFEEFDFSNYDLVLSCTTRFAKGVITQPETCHVCYCHTPPRFAWRPNDYFVGSPHARLLTPFMRGMMRDLRVWDIASSQRVDYFAANSHNVARRIRKVYRRESTVIYPPVQTSRFLPAPAHEIGPHFLIVSRLVGYKRVDLAIEACNQLGLPLRVIGTGPEEAALRRLAGPGVTFLGRVPDGAVAAEMARCRALIFPGEEDFGLTPLEAMACGRPVVAYGAGGAVETVVDGVTGVLFAQQTPECLGAALQVVGTLPTPPGALRAHAERFDTASFMRQMSAFLDEALEQHRRTYQMPLEWTSPDRPEDLVGRFR
ncbi:MAG: glycosyltransferase [Armatimonadetes bacterium]|nr:glycosyltransferase [Armatimonadota bacterium]